MEIKDAHEIHIPPKPREELEDRKLLDRPSRETRLQSESWRVLRITSEFVAGFDHLADVYPAVSIFGSARTQLSNEFYEAAVTTAELLGRAGFAIITGGGPGIMEAANKGAKQAGAISIGCNIELPFEQQINQFVDRSMTSSRRTSTASTSSTSPRRCWTSSPPSTIRRCGPTGTRTRRRRT